MSTSPVRIQARHLLLAAGLSCLFLFSMIAWAEAEEFGPPPGGTMSPPPSGSVMPPPPGGMMSPPQNVEAKVFINDGHLPPPPPGGMMPPSGKQFMPPEGSGMFKPGDPSMGDPGMMNKQYGKDTVNTHVFIDNKGPQPGQKFYGPTKQGMMNGQQGQYGGQQQGGMMDGERSDEQMEKEQQMREQQDLKRMQQGMRGMEQGMKMYRSQLVKLQKQGIAVPASVSESLDKIVPIIAAIKNAKTFDEAREAGMEELPDLMSGLDENREMLEKLSRWKQTISQVDRTLKNLKSQLARDKRLVPKLTKQGFDIAELVAQFESGAGELQATRNQAVELIKTDPEAAFTLLEDGFFEKMEEVMKSEHIIQGLANYGQFAAQFKKRLADADKMIRNLKRKDVDTTTLEEDLVIIKEKGNELKAAIQNKEFDEDTLPELFESLQEAWMRFESTMDDLTESESRPWEQGPDQFRSVSSQYSQFIPMGGGGGGEQF